MLGTPSLRVLKQLFRFPCGTLRFIYLIFFCGPFLATFAMRTKHKLYVPCTPSTVPKFEALLLKYLLLFPYSSHWYLLSIGIIPLSKFCLLTGQDHHLSLRLRRSQLNTFIVCGVIRANQVLGVISGWCWSLLSSWGLPVYPQDCLWLCCCAVGTNTSNLDLLAFMLLLILIWVLGIYFILKMGVCDLSFKKQ